MGGYGRGQVNRMRKKHIPLSNTTNIRARLNKTFRYSDLFLHAGLRLLPSPQGEGMGGVR
jgi:hypothetical protein